jgi:3-hydroxyisobutyrate dehydrogenase-like beta-hydroxyacid dehydrogenase
MSRNIYNESKAQPGVVSVGIIGLGIVGSVLARILSKNGIHVCIYDVLCNEPQSQEILKARAQTVGAKLALLPDLIQQSTWVISSVTTQMAEEVARQCLPLLDEDQVFFDVNSTSSKTKIFIQTIILSGKATFVEGVILNAVNFDDTTLNLLTAGEKGTEVADFLFQVGIKAKFYGNEVGKASQFKMIRSIFSKGLEVLLLETMVTAKKAGIDQEIWEEINSFMDSKPFSEIASTWIESHPRACERRFHEMQQVIETMKDIGVKRTLTEATLQYFADSVNLNFHKSIKSNYRVDEVIALLVNK